MRSINGKLRTMAKKDAVRSADQSSSQSFCLSVDRSVSHPKGCPMSEHSSLYMSQNIHVLFITCRRVGGRVRKSSINPIQVIFQHQILDWHCYVDLTAMYSLQSNIQNSEKSPPNLASLMVRQSVVLHIRSLEGKMDYRERFFPIEARALPDLIQMTRT